MHRYTCTTALVHIWAPPHREWGSVSQKLQFKNMLTVILMHDSAQCSSRDCVQRYFCLGYIIHWLWEATLARSKETWPGAQDTGAATTSLCQCNHDHTVVRDIFFFFPLPSTPTKVRGSCLSHPVMPLDLGVGGQFGHCPWISGYSEVDKLQPLLLVRHLMFY